MRRSRRPHDDTEQALANFALTLAKVLMVVFVIAVSLISETKKQDSLTPKVDYIVSLTWPDGVDYDIDLWIRNPKGERVYYAHKEGGNLTIERDDLGMANDVIKGPNGQTTVLTLANEEIASVRGIIPGEYVINVFLYSAGEIRIAGTPVNPIEVTLKVVRLNPKFVDVTERKITLDAIKQEKHGVRFTLKPDGGFSDVTSDLPVMITIGN